MECKAEWMGDISTFAFCHMSLSSTTLFWWERTQWVFRKTGVCKIKKWDKTFLVVALEKWPGHAVTSAEYNAILLLTLDSPLNTIKGPVAIFYKVTNQIEKI